MEAFSSSQSMAAFIRKRVSSKAPNNNCGIGGVFSSTLFLFSIIWGPTKPRESCKVRWAPKFLLPNFFILSTFPQFWNFDKAAAAILWQSWTRKAKLDKGVKSKLPHFLFHHYWMAQLGTWKILQYDNSQSHFLLF